MISRRYCIECLENNFAYVPVTIFSSDQILKTGAPWAETESEVEDRNSKPSPFRPLKQFILLSQISGLTKQLGSVRRVHVVAFLSELVQCISINTKLN